MASTAASAGVVQHPTAIIDPRAELSPGVEVGPNCIIRGNVTLGPNVKLIANVYLEGPVTIGAETMLYPGVCIGLPPQDVKFKPGDPTAGVKIGTKCLIREHVTIHAASKADSHPTTVGDNCFLMVASHLGHDTVIGNNVIMVNAVLLAGHVTVGDNVTMGGGAMVHQFCRIGRLSFLSGNVAMAMDMPPFCLAASRNALIGLNAVGLRRNGVPRDQIMLLREAFRVGLGERSPRQQTLERLAPLAAKSPFVAEFRDFIATSKRGVAPARISGETEDGDT